MYRYVGNEIISGENLAKPLKRQIPISSRNKFLIEFLEKYEPIL